eukprot:4016832-Pyramimonas_sp.AAC.1
MSLANEQLFKDVSSEPSNCFMDVSRMSQGVSRLSRGCLKRNKHILKDASSETIRFLRMSQAKTASL